MIEKEIHFITDFSLNKIKNLGSSFTMKGLFNIELHPALIKYVSGRLDYMIYEERKILLENSRFDYSGTKISEYFNLISEEIKKTKKITFNEAEDFIKKGVVFNANFSVQPKSSLTNLIFKNADAYKTTAEIKVCLNYLYYYDYYREIINSYIAGKKVVHLSKYEFRTVLDKIDENLLSSKKEDIISDAINSISDFYNIGGISKSSVQMALVEAFLKEKNLDEIIEIIHKEINGNKKKIDLIELQKIIFSPVIIKEEAEDDGSIEEIKTEPKVSNEIFPEIEFREEKGGANLIKEEQPDENAEDKEEKLQDEEKTPDKLVEDKNLEKMPEEAAEEDKPDQEDLLSIYDQGEMEREELIPQEEILDSYDIEVEPIKESIEKEFPLKNKNRDIFSFLSQKEIDKIISAVFNDDEDDFANTLEKITECRDYDKAAEILESVFYTYKVNPYKREAVSLTNAVSNYFNQE
jgi:hypothetical protein